MRNKSNATLTFSYTNDDSEIKNIFPKRKVIRMLSKGFCIAVISGERKAERLFQYAFADGLSVEEKVDAVLKTNQELGIACEKNLFRLYTQYNTQIPEPFYEQENDASILSLMMENAEEYVPVAEKIDAWKLYNLSAWDTKLYACVKKKFPDYELGTVVSSLLSVVAGQKSGKDTFVFTGDNNFTILAVEGDKLLGINTFDFSNESDFLYYVYGFLRKMYLYPDAVSLKLGGNIAVKSSLYDVLSKYFSQIELASFPNAMEDYSYFCDLFE